MTTTTRCHAALHTTKLEVLYCAQAITKASPRLLAPTLAVPLQMRVIMAGQKMKEYARK